MIRRVANGEVQGTFYGSPITQSQVNTLWGRPVVAFVTNDGSGAYHTSFELVDGALRGTTHALGRQFLSVWTGKRL